MIGQTYEAVEQAGKNAKWRLSLGPDSFRLDPSDTGQTIEVTRAERTARVDLVDGLFFKRLLGVQAGKQKKVFRLDPAGFAAYREWAGPPTLADLRKSLKRRFGFSLFFGALIIFTSLPLGGDPERG